MCCHRNDSFLNQVEASCNLKRNHLPPGIEATQFLISPLVIKHGSGKSPTNRIITINGPCSIAMFDYRRVPYIIHISIDFNRLPVTKCKENREKKSNPHGPSSTWAAYACDFAVLVPVQYCCRPPKIQVLSRKLPSAERLICGGFDELWRCRCGWRPVVPLSKYGKYR